MAKKALYLLLLWKKQTEHAAYPSRRGCALLCLRRGVHHTLRPLAGEWVYRRDALQVNSFASNLSTMLWTKS